MTGAKATFLVTDLADFTPLAETLPPDRLVALLNGYLEGVTEVVFGHGGTVMKIIGDAVQAIFGAPVANADHARQAVACALAIDRFAESFRGAQREVGIPLGPTRIGVNSGEGVIGNFGGAHYFDYTAFGDAVNVAARLERANKVIGTQICVSEAVVAEIPRFVGRPVGRLLLRGKTQPLKCYEPLELANADTGLKYSSAFALREAGDPKSRQAFAALVSETDDDPLALFHLGRLLRGEAGSEIALGEA